MSVQTPDNVPAVKKPKKRTRRTRQEESDMNRDIGYLIAKFESLDSYIRDHMRTEENKFDGLYKSIKRIQLALTLLTIIVVLMASGIPVDGFILKLLGFAL